MADKQIMELRPQKGPQERFLTSKADIVIYGGAAGGGKTYGMLLECLRHISTVKGFGAVVFRRESTQITNEGGLWDEAMKVYPYCGGVPRMSSPMSFVFPPFGNRVSFNHLYLEADILGWQGAQIPLIMFDELTHFSRSQFFYMLSRNRSGCGVKPYIRASTNPDADSWVKEFISWWIDADTGLPIPERDGVVRYFARVNDVLTWGDDPDKMAEELGISRDDCKSVTFIAAKVSDNKILMSKDPGYLANLKALSRVERERLLNGNWNAKSASGAYFRRLDAQIVAAMPHVAEVQATCRAWDLAATEVSEESQNPDWTVGVKMSRISDGTFLIWDMTRAREKSNKVRERILRTSAKDNSREMLAAMGGNSATIRIPQDPGQAGKDQAQSIISSLAGYAVRAIRPTGDKVSRAEPFASQWQAGNIRVLSAPWNETLFQELESFPDASCHDDIVDACADAFNELSLGSISNVSDSAGEMESANADW